MMVGTGFLCLPSLYHFRDFSFKVFLFGTIRSVGGIACTVKNPERKAGVFPVAKVMPNYKFNNPNSLEDTTEMLLALFMETNKTKADQAIKNAWEHGEETPGHPA